MNALRDKNGLPPADGFTGSSLWLVHKQSPGETTLQNPGVLITDLPERREFLSANPAIAWQCSDRVGVGVRPDMSPVPDTVYLIDTPKGFIEGKDDWYSEISEGLIEAQGRCLEGNATYCAAITTMAEKWADADALKLGPGLEVDGAENAIWIGNTLLRDIIFAYVTATAFEDLTPATHAKILDWFKRRIDDYHYIRRGLDPSSNHALAHMMPAAAFGAMVGDRSMLEPAFARWQIVLDSMRGDGSLPVETKRGARWFHYSTLQIGQLLTVQQLARSQDIDLVPADPDRTIPRAVTFAIDALGDFSLANTYAKENSGGGESDDYSIPFVRNFHLGFVAAYRDLYGDAVVDAMRDSPVDSRLCSDAAFREDKVDACPFNKKTPLTLGSLAKVIGFEADHNMGYPAGCFVGQTPSPLDARN